MNDSAKHNLDLTQAESKLALCLFAHLRHLSESIGLPRGGIIRPINMDQADILLCSSSIRTLLLDDTLAGPCLIKFFEKHSVPFLIPCLETNINLFFTSHFFAGDSHVSDLLLRILLDAFVYKGEDAPKIGKEGSFFLFYQSGKGFESLFKQREKWLPKISEHPETTLGISGTKEGFAPSQTVFYNPRLVDAREWGKVRFGYLKNVPIRRENIVKFVANSLGGVHYDRHRLPPEKDRNEFQLISEAYDWNNEAIIHAGLICVFLMSVEVMLSAEVTGLLPALTSFLNGRQERLLKRKDISE